MSLLWKRKGGKLSKRMKRPSPAPEHTRIIARTNPANDKKKRNPAQGWNVAPEHNVRGASLSALLHRWAEGGMTVEAALVLPLFLFFFLNLSCAMELIRLHGNIQLALWETGTRLSVYGFALGKEEVLRSAEEREGSWGEEIAGIAFSYAYIKSKLTDSLGEEYLNASPLERGADGLQFWESKILPSKDEVEITVTYAVSPWYSVVGFRPFRMANRYYCHIWNGYDVAGGSGENGELPVTVYVAENGEVYHRDRNCSHLQLSVREIADYMLNSCRNENGERYVMCEKCKSSPCTGILYITAEGSRYHYGRDCPGLKRTVFSILLKDAGGYRPCSRCGGI